MERGWPRLRPPQGAARARQLGGQRQIADRGRRSARGKGPLRRPGQIGRGEPRFRLAAAVVLILPITQANTIAEPLRKLAEAAERVQRGIRSRQQIPDFTNRSDEIGHLSRALGEMTHALYSRIEDRKSVV